MVRYQKGRQLLAANHADKNGDAVSLARIGKMSADTIAIGDELVAKIFLLDADLEIMNAFADCAHSEALSVDTTTYEVDGCTNKLLVRNDTIFIGFRPQTAGVKTFDEITILVRDNERIFRVYPYSFPYTVIEPDTMR